MKTVYSIFFEKDHFNLNNYHLVLLNAVVVVMLEDKELLLKLSAHADSDGDSIYNKKLTDSRLKSVLNYIKQKGMSDNRLEKFSYGKSHPFNNNLNEFEKSINRRVLFHFLKENYEVEIESKLNKVLKTKIKNDINKLYIREIDGKYLIQLGAYKSKKQADMIALKLENLFPDNTFVEEEDQYFKVRVGYMKTSVDANKIRTLIQSSNILEN